MDRHDGRPPLRRRRPRPAAHERDAVLADRHGGSSARIYYERAHADYWTSPPEPSPVPTALADFPHDNFIPLRHIADRTNNITRWTSYDRGGHFPALEVPDLLVADVRAFFRTLRDRTGDAA